VSDTPRTDAEQFNQSFVHFDKVVPAKFAKQLERELEEAKRNSFSRACDLIDDIKDERYGRPMVAALHLCIDMEDALHRAQAGKYLCPVCDDVMEYPPRDHAICSCCQTHFSYDDCDASYDELRRRWIRTTIHNDTDAGQMKKVDV
jgi:hypothetical protein